MERLLDIINSIVKAPGTWIPGETYLEFIAFIGGYNTASNGEPLKGFHEWLVLKYDGGDCLHWSAICLNISGLEISFLKMSQEQNVKAIEAVSGLLFSFHEYKLRHGVDHIFIKHKEWLTEHGYDDIEIFF